MYERTQPPPSSPVAPILPGHPRWNEFVDCLVGPEGCAFNGETWTCFGDTRFTERLLRQMELDPATIAICTRHFRRRGGYCDCEVVFNVGHRFREWFRGSTPRSVKRPRPGRD